MRLILRLGLFAALLGLLLGVALRVVLGRRRLVAVARLSPALVVVHASYLVWFALKEGAPAVGAAVFALVALAVAVGGALAAPRLLRRSAFQVALLPLYLLGVHGLVGSLYFYLSLGPADAVPSAVPAASLALASLAYACALAAFVPLAGRSR